jgi:hypothetical protein
MIQITTWEEMAKQYRRVVDKLGKKIDEGIFDTVVALNILGVVTRASCEGHLDWGVPHPWVDIEAEIAVKYRLHQLLSQFYASRLERPDFDATLCFHGYRLRPQGAPYAELFSTEERAQKLAIYRSEMDAFTAYLRLRI